MPQQAVANGMGQRLERRAQLITRRSCVVRKPSTGSADSMPMRWVRWPPVLWRRGELGAAAPGARGRGPEDPAVDLAALLVRLLHILGIGANAAGRHDALVAAWEAEAGREAD